MKSKYQIHIFLFVTLLGAAVCVNAKAPGCDELLQVQMKQYTQADYLYSDLEGLYLDFVESATQLTNAHQAKNVDLKLERHLNKKASVLNQMMMVIQVIRQEVTYLKEDHSQTLEEIENMLKAMGLSPLTYGIKRDPALKEIYIDSIPKRQPTEGPANDNEYVGNPIGFGKNEKDYRKDGYSRPGFEIDENWKSTDTEDRKTRSIGFGKALLPKATEAPLRQVDDLDYAVDKNKNLVVIDKQTGKSYSVALSALQYMSLETSTKGYKLEFSTEEGEWMLLVTNKTNPSGKIGF